MQLFSCSRVAALQVLKSEPQNSGSVVLTSLKHLLCLLPVFSKMQRITEAGQVLLEAICGVQWLRHRHTRELAGPLSVDACLFTEESDGAFVQDEDGSTWCSELLRFSDCYVDESGFIAVADKETGA
eukprot:3821648-Amphidinium_carterae.1